MSTFSGLSTALSSLTAQRQALDVSGQNVANVNTVGYTRQRANLTSVGGVTVPSMFSVSNGVGNGTKVSDFARLGDVFLDTRVRVQTSSATYLKAVADGLKALEATVGEPSASKTGFSDQLTAMWGAWNDLANTPDTEAARSVVLETSSAVAARLGSMYAAARTEWNQQYDTAVALVAKTNATAANVADLNARIQQITNSGGVANELIDARDLAVTELAALVGGTVQYGNDGQVDVLVGGNPLVAGSTARELKVSGAPSFGHVMGTAGGEATAVTIEWASRPGSSAGLDGGQLAGILAVLAPANETGTGGPLAEAAARYDRLAVDLARQVNDLHAGAYTVDGQPGGEFFTFTGQPGALSLTVAITDPSRIAVSASAQDQLDGSVAARLAALGTTPGGPDAQWNAFVVDLGSRTSSAGARAAVSEVARASAVSQQLANASVDLDEETVNMVAYQRAYEGAARVLTAIDQMLDTLINRTGVVGR
ncbi:flagellar hook-associated protein FlgK [Xylanimonas oleitrophica]|uniref:Flagellar hook-associated protein 1 n=1 Tax=Xylanimonas oleitrophica TaxID=2607479 RepID=A0A2W5WRZ1_9MICO|nr:flagellar hook-associated protein FlgK [Xylanimonas oleitrophica]PZR54117.1 flagellar hook-associated protein FlgK [Xylanimonas oleitrophica]